MLDYDPVLAHLFLDKKHLFNTLDNEVATGIIGALLDSRQLLVAHVLEPAVAGSEHHGHATDLYLPHHYLIAQSILDVDKDWG